MITHFLIAVLAAAVFAVLNPSLLASSLSPSLADVTALTPPRLNQSIIKWKERGHFIRLGSHEIFTVIAPCSSPSPSAKTIVLVHGYPSSSYDYSLLVDDLAAIGTVIVMDHIGFGFSSKPFQDFTYSVFEHADNVIRVLQSQSVSPHLTSDITFIAHDMGDSVLAEIVTRRHRGLLPEPLASTIRRVMFTNGGMDIRKASLRWGQIVLLSPLGPLLNYFISLTPSLAKAVREQQLRSIWSPSADVKQREKDIEEMTQLIDLNGGNLQGSRNIRYLGDRYEYEYRWFEALSTLDIPCKLLWGDADAVSPVAIPLSVRGKSNSHCDLHLLEGVGHFLMLEAPRQWTAHVASFIRDHDMKALQARGILAQTTKRAAEALSSSPTSVYIGFDPTANGLHVGHLVGVRALQQLQREGHRPICLVGGATGMIGDPSGKQSDRVLLDDEAIHANRIGLKKDLSLLIDFADESNYKTLETNTSGTSTSSNNKAILVDNLDWYKDMSAISFVRDIGRHFRVGTMMSRDSVKSRLESEVGMSFTEFTYQLFQGYDFLHLNKHYNCTVQLGGSDQWGNIISGCDLVRRVTGSEVHGVTVPLLTTSTGEKFGKSAGNAVWLSREKTSDFEFYQYFWRTEDSDVGRLLKIFSDLSIPEIEELEVEHGKNPGKREAQEVLASHVTKLVRGDAGVTRAKKASAVLYGGSFDGVDAVTLKAIFADVPCVTLPHIFEKTLLDIVVEAGVCPSKTEARRLLKSGGLYINNVRVPADKGMVVEEDLIDGTVCVFRTGKKNYRLVKIV